MCWRARRGGRTLTASGGETAETAMTYLCYIYRRTRASPYFEVLPDMPRLNAIERAGALLAERPDGDRAELWDGDKLVFTLPRPQTGDQALISK